VGDWRPEAGDWRPEAGDMYTKGIAVGALTQAFVTAALADDDDNEDGLALLTGGNIQAGARRPPGRLNPYLTIFALPGMRKINCGIEEIPIQFVCTATNIGNTKTMPDIETLDAIIGRVQELFVNQPESISVDDVKILGIVPDGGPQVPVWDESFKEEHYGWMRLRVMAVKLD
jgi:hypothetical protein